MLPPSGREGVTHPFLPPSYLPFDGEHSSRARVPLFLSSLLVTSVSWWRGLPPVFRRTWIFPFFYDNFPVSRVDPPILARQVAPPSLVLRLGVPVGEKLRAGLPGCPCPFHRPFPLQLRIAVPEFTHSKVSLMSFWCGSHEPFLVICELPFPSLPLTFGRSLVGLLVSRLESSSQVPSFFPSGLQAVRPFRGKEFFFPGSLNFPLRFFCNCLLIIAGVVA